MSGGLLAIAASISTLALAASVISAGLLADRLGRRRVLMSALMISAIGGVIVALAPTSSLYLLGRGLAGVGLGAVYGAAFAYIRAVTPLNRVPGALGIFGAVAGLVTVILTFVGGALSSLDWRLAFVVIPAMCLIGLIGVRAILPVQPKVTSGKQDLIGQILLALGVVGVLYGFSHAGKGLLSPLTIGPLLAGLVLLVGFFLFESRNEDRFFPVSLFKNPIFLAAICAGFVYNFGSAISFLQLANLWQYVTKLTSFEVALWQLPLLGVGIISALVFGLLMLRGMTNGAALLIASVVSSAGFVYLGFFHSSSTLLGFLPGLILVGGGMVIAALPFGNLILAEAPANYFGPVTSARTTIGQFFYAAGLALGTVLIDKMTVGGTVAKLEASGVPPTQTGAALDAVTAFASQGTQPSTSLGQQALAIAAPSYASAFGVVMMSTGVITLIVGVIGFLLLRGSPQTAAPAEKRP